MCSVMCLSGSGCRRVLYINPIEIVDFTVFCQLLTTNSDCALVLIWFAVFICIYSSHKLRANTVVGLVVVVLEQY